VVRESRGKRRGGPQPPRWCERVSYSCSSSTTRGMSTAAPFAPPPDPKYNFDAEMLPIGPLQSLRFKVDQTVESIVALQRLIAYGGAPAMPAWPEIMSKYTILLSQMHSLMASLAGLSGGGTALPDGGSVFSTLSLHPRAPVAEDAGRQELIGLLRNQQTNDVLADQDRTVRRLAEHMQTRGVLGLMAGQGGPPPNFPPGSEWADGRRKVKEEDVLEECEAIRAEHDGRAERAVRALAMLRERFDFKLRVQVDQEEPEELDWDPRLGGGAGQTVGEGARGDAHGQEDEEGTTDDEEDGEEDEEEDDDDDEDEEGVEDALGLGTTPASDMFSLPGTPAVQ
jgi:hypothetical protein